ncbi:rrg1 [Candida jiufengensis]|uniref:rrg1 n=1 Tax=Candida jiufengensis TaxID=497108 RepID=UPI0022240587|nr:rrg1 [Candida jiufengensis]KAI5951301.1 rrg1 [Candida jiufengensis]
MDFDPLSFISSPKIEHEIEELETAKDDKLISRVEIQENEEVLDEESIEDEDDHLQPLHILDLPLLKLKPTYETLSVILKLLSPDEKLNFSQNNEDTIVNEEDILVSKNILYEELQLSLVWLEQHCPRFNKTTKLMYLPKLSTSLKLQYNDYNAYLTRIISNELPWLSNNQREIIHNLTSLRISENCGRMAQPEIIRKITFPNLDTKTGRSFIKLKEPSMTNDNLGLKTWGSSLILSQRLINKFELGKEVPVLELGSGTGLVGITLALLGYNVYFTDLPEILPNLKTNLELNELKQECFALDWSKPESSPLSYKKFECIVISDPIYSSSHPKWLVNTINSYSSNSMNSFVLIELPLRPNFENERKELWELFNSYNFKKIETEIEDGYDDFGEMKFCYKKFQKIIK